MNAGTDITRDDAVFIDEIAASGPQFISRASHLILWASVAFFVFVLAWASYATVDQVTRGVGRVIPSGQVQTVQNLEGGILSAILVKSGDRVEQGQVLLRIDNTQFDSAFRETQLQIASLRTKIARLSAEVDGVPFEPTPALENNPEILRNEMALYHSRQNELETGINVLRQTHRQKEEELSGLLAENRTLQDSVALARQELDMKQPLVDKGVLPKIETLGIERDLTTLNGRLEANEHAIPRARGALDEIDQRIEERKAAFRTQALSDLNDNKVNLSRLEELRRTQEDRVRRTEVRAPVTGTVKEVKVNTLGGVIQPGMDLIEIVPTEESLVVEAEVSPRDIAFLHPGQDAVIKLTAYDFAIYGGLKATLESISADTLINDAGNRVYRIRLRTTQNHLGGADKPLPIIPGMAAEVDIVTGNKTVMTYLLKPLRRARDRALTER